MDNQDKIFEKIKNAAQKAEEKDFPGMERIWQQVDAKLEKKELQTKNKIWKKIAIAASVVLVISLGYQFLKPTTVNSIQNEVVVKKDSLKIINETATVNTLIDTAKIESVLNETKTTIVEKETSNNISQPNAIALQENPAHITEETVEKEQIRNKKEIPLKKKSGTFHNNVFDAMVAESVYAKKEQKDTVISKKAVETDAPLVVMNGKVASTKYKSVQEVKKNVSRQLDGEEIESLVVLKEPLYIINGVEYTEESLFGPKPTSPYYPLSKQNIEKLEILQDEEALAQYGEKGKKGVVIITTKNGIPSQK